MESPPQAGESLGWAQVSRRLGQPGVPEGVW